VKVIIGPFWKFKILRNRVVKLIRRDKLAYHNTLFQQFRSNPKRFYGYFRRMETVKTTVAGIRKADGNLTKTDEEAAGPYALQFKKTFIDSRQMAPRKGF